MQNYRLLLLAGIALLSYIAFAFYNQERWLGFYYPNGCLECTEEYIYSPEFETKAACFAWASNLKNERNNPADRFECGKNCKAPEYEGGFYVCEETADL